jgi:septum formation protein
MILNETFPTLFLASGSPRRRQLLLQLGWKIQIFPTQIDETPLSGESSTSYVLRLATSKAKTLFNRMKERTLSSSDTVYIMAADTAVVDGHDILGKPEDHVAAVAMLSKLRQRMHQVYSGVTVVRLQKTADRSKGNEKDFSLLSDVCIKDVVMRNYHDDELVTYVTTNDPFDKAGGYAIQHTDFHPVASIKGCYLNVVGLPLCHLTRQLIELGANTGTDYQQILACCRQVATNGLLREDCCHQIWEQFGWL